MIDAALEGRIREAIDRDDFRAATTEAVRGYGPQIAGYLRAVLRSDDAAVEAFSQFCEFVWKGIPKFRQEASFLTWSYQLAWAAVRRISEDPYRRRARRLTTGEMEGLAAEVYSTGLERREQAMNRVAELRAQLTAAEQTLLVLRIDRRLSWKEIALVLDEGGEPAAAASALRKRFERLKGKVREARRARGAARLQEPVDQVELGEGVGVAVDVRAAVGRDLERADAVDAAGIGGHDRVELSPSPGRQLDRGHDHGQAEDAGDVERAAVGREAERPLARLDAGHDGSGAAAVEREQAHVRLAVDRRDGLAVGERVSA